MSFQKRLEKAIARKEKEIEKEDLKVEKIQSEVNEYSRKLVEIDNYQKIVEESVISKEKNEKSCHFTP